jgi:hypothetical protein
VRNQALHVVSKIAAFLLAASLGACTSARADSAPPVPVLLELFTSEGCSSCPPADALLKQLDRTQPVRGAHLIVLSEHVDYWNSIGWKDPYSSARFTARQTNYADRIDPANGVYTPQLIVDGRESVVGSDRSAVFGAISKAITHTKRQLAIDRVSRDGRTIALHVDGGIPEHAADLYVAVAYNAVSSHVTGGENAGRTLTHVAVVRTLARVGTFPAGENVSKDVVLPVSVAGTGGLRLIVFLVDRRSGAVVAATQQGL